MTNSAERIAACAKRGAAWLDDICPDWYNHIDCWTLDLGCACRCVLGQLGHARRTPSYLDVIHFLESSTECPSALSPLMDLGFAMFGCNLDLQPDATAAWTILNTAWRREIQRRKHSDTQ